MNRPRILLVEDSLTQAVAMSDMLERAGYAVRHVPSAERALAELNGELPDLVMLDYHLPGMQGNELCRLIRLNAGTIGMPILVLTNDDSPACQREGLESGADDFLPKSQSAELILMRAGNLLRHAREASEETGLPRAVFRQPLVLIVGTPGGADADLERALVQEGCRVERAADGEAARVMVAARPFDCALVAETVGGAAGDALCAALREVAVGDPTLILMLDRADSTRSRPGHACDGVDDCIEPQLDLSVLRARLRAMLRRRFLMEQNRRLLDDHIARETETIRLRAEREAAEARAALADELRLANERLQAANRRLSEQASVTRTITHNVTSALFMVDAGGRPTFMNPSAETLLGCALAELGGRPLAELVTMDDPAERDALAALSPVRNRPAAVRHTDGRTVPVTVSLAPLSGGDGGAVVEVVDVTERRKAERQQALLMAELSHRVKNTMATVLSIASQTKQRHDTLESFWPAFVGRLQALSSTHNLLAQHLWGSVQLGDVLRHETAPYRDESRGNLALSGEPLLLTSRAALSLGMVFHELATNAAKYGAFSTPDGAVAVRWTRSPEGDAVTIAWEESGGPPVQAPSRRGFGSRLIEKGLAYELGGRASLEFRPGGLACTIELPLSDHVHATGGDTAPMPILAG